MVPAARRPRIATGVRMRRLFTGSLNARSPMKRAITVKPRNTSGMKRCRSRMARAPTLRSRGADHGGREQVQRRVHQVEDGQRVDAEEDAHRGERVERDALPEREPGDELLPLLVEAA